MGGQGQSILVEGRLGLDKVENLYVFKFLDVSWQDRAEKEAARFKPIKKLRPDIARVAQLREVMKESGRAIGLIYDYVEGRTLDKFGIELRRSAQHMSGADLQKMCISILSTLKSLHYVNVIHRDVKPMNIIIDEAKSPYQVTLIDFGLIAEINKKTLLIAGTNGFAAPEVWAGKDPQPNQDVWGFAATMIDFLVGPVDDLFKSNRFELPADEKLSILDPLARAILNILYRGVGQSPDTRPTIQEFINLLTAVDELKAESGSEQINPFVEGLLSVRIGSTGVLAPVDDSVDISKSFNWMTHVDSLLDKNLLQDLLSKNFSSVFLTGNPGDGKTTFITRLRDYLMSKGGVYTSLERFTGWQIKYKEHIFVAIYDASESVDGVSSNERLKNVLKLSLDQGVTAVIAANDGRLDAFFLEFSDEFIYADDVRAQLRGSDPVDKKVLVVDLKRRALVSFAGDGGLIRKNLNRFVSVDEDWKICDTCSSKNVCSILRNRNFLNQHSAMVSVEKLHSISHLQREKRTTFRDIRSVFAYLITGDKKCEDVHSAKKSNINLRKFPGLNVFELAFNAAALDSLVLEWSKFDPANLSLSGIRRAAVRVNKLIDADTGLNNVPNLSRKIFFGETPPNFSSEEIDDVNFYRYLDSYKLLLAGLSPATKDDLLRGLSGMSGTSPSENFGLLIGSDNSESDWSVVKVIPSNEFQIINDQSSGNQYLEAIVDGATLIHTRSSVALKLSLDSFELIMRVANGALVNDRFSDSVFQEIRGFTNQLHATQVSKAFIVDPSGQMIEAVDINGKIDLAWVR